MIGWHEMTVWRTYYHLVWTTCDRLPLITPAVETELYDYLGGKSRSLSCPIHALGGVVDHIHLVVSIPPSLAISAYAKQMKGSSSRFMNQLSLEQQFAWQREYAVFSLGGKQLDQAVAYVQNQKEHHAQGTVIRILEPNVC